jgi:hypothetical protein
MYLAMFISGNIVSFQMFLQDYHPLELIVGLKINIAQSRVKGHGSRLGDSLETKMGSSTVVGG